MASQQEISKYKAQAAFIFTGKVIKLKASTVPNISVDNTAIVQVDHIVTAPPAFSTITGAQVTVRLKKLSDIKQGTTLTFYTNGWVYGAGLAVDAVGYQKQTGRREMAAMVRSSHSAAADNALMARLDSAEIAVAGSVTSVQPQEVAPTHVSEHDPAWQQARIKVDEVLKGKKNTKEVKLLFPSSDDVRWYKVPKYIPGQQGIWLLHDAQKQDPKGIAPKVVAAMSAVGPALTAVHPVDFLPLEELGRVKALLQK